MSYEPHGTIQRVTRYNLTITFEELYTSEAQELDASANAIGQIISVIQQLLSADPPLQAMLASHQLTMTMIAPTRTATEPSATATGDSE